MVKNFYVCSYGGSGSKMLCAALARYGKVKHIHSKQPPNKLEYIGDEKGGKPEWHEWFNGIVIPEDEVKDYSVIFIYRNPSFAIPSRFYCKQHLKHIQCDNSIKLDDVLSSCEDLYKLREFYDNYMKPNKNRNYKIYCVKYEDIFDKQDELSRVLEVGKLYMVNQSTRKDSNEILDKIYSDLIEEMNNNDFIIIN